MADPRVMREKFAAVRSYNDCFALQEQGEPVLLALARQGERTRKQTVAVLLCALTEFNNFLHLKNPLTNEEGSFIAEQIVDEFGGALTLADVNLVLHKAKAGQYGKMYERLSAPTVMSWFRQYYDERLDAASNYQVSKKREARQTAMNSRVADAIVGDPGLKQLVASMAIKSQPKTVEDMTKKEYEEYLAKLNAENTETQMRMKLKYDNIMSKPRETWTANEREYVEAFTPIVKKQQPQQK